MTDNLIVRRAAAVQEAQTDLLRYVQLLHPTPDHPDDPDQSLYQVAKHHTLLADTLEQVLATKLKRVIIIMPPRHGKTELATKTFVPYYMGRHPKRSVIVATYSDEFAGDLGRAIRANIQHPATRQVFPRLELDQDSRSASRMETTDRGAVAVVGRGSAITGRGGDLLIVDDPIKDRKEADSAAIRNQLWDWFNQVFMTRLMTDSGCAVLIQTRWHEDDLVGRLTDPRNPNFNPREARKWKVIHIRAIAHANDILKRRPGQALWPKRFGLKFLRGIQQRDSRGFSALYQGDPSPAEGAFFQEHGLIQYNKNAFPAKDALRWYMASDHAVSTAQDADRNCMGVIGVDQFGMIYVHPRLVWQRMRTDQVVEAALSLVREFKPIFWFSERGVITKSIGPFLRKRMLETQTFANIREFTPIADKQARAQSIAGRIGMGMVKFPGFASWWPDAKHEMLTFPHGSNDDFVDFLSLVGLGMDSLGVAENPQAARLNALQEPKFGTIGWVRASQRRADARKRTARAQGW